MPAWLIDGWQLWCGARWSCQRWEIVREGQAPSAHGAVYDGSQGPQSFLLFFSRVNASTNWKEGTTSSSVPLPLINGIGEASGSSSKSQLICGVVAMAWTNSVVPRERATQEEKEEIGRHGVPAEKNKPLDHLWTSGRCLTGSRCSSLPYLLLHRLQAPGSELLAWGQSQAPPSRVLRPQPRATRGTINAT